MLHAQQNATALNMALGTTWPPHTAALWGHLCRKFTLTFSFLFHKKRTKPPPLPTPRQMGGNISNWWQFFFFSGNLCAEGERLKGEQLKGNWSRVPRPLLQALKGHLGKLCGFYSAGKMLPASLGKRNLMVLFWFNTKVSNANTHAQAGRTVGSWGFLAVSSAKLVIPLVWHGNALSQSERKVARNLGV